MNFRRGSFSSVLELVSHNTGMYEEELLDDRKTYRINGLAEAKDMLTEAMESQKTIYVFGDYDVDGVCASAIIGIGMASIGYREKTIVRLPKRFSEGYGVSEKAVDEFEDGQVLVTVDNGIAAMPAIKKAKGKGMKVIVIDHHLPPQDVDGNTILPDADLIIDPKAIPKSADFDGYCGAGLAYRVMCRLVRDRKTVWKMLCLAAIATIADVMPLTGENRRLVRCGIAGMTDINRTTSGLYALLLACGCTEYVTEETVSYKLAPCLNAPGRLFDCGAEESYRLLAYDGNLSMARKMAEQQLDWNKTRRSLSEKWGRQAMDQARTHILMGKKPVILRIDGIPEGISGIVAGRVAEHVKCPCIVLAQVQGNPGMLKGSARSYGDAHLFHLIQQGKEFLARFGGHKEAAGLSIMEEDLDSFRERMYKVYNQNSQEDAASNDFYYDLEVEGNDVENLRGILGDIQKYGPYGQGNPQPVLFIKGLLLIPCGSGYYQYMGNHSAVRMSSKELDCVSFHDIEKFERLGAPAIVDVMGTVTINHYMGNSRYRLEFFYIAKSQKAKEKKSTLASLISQKAGRRYQGGIDQ